MNNRRPSFEVIDAFFLAIPTSTEASFEFLDSTIRKAFAFEGPSGGEDVHVFSARDKFPTIKIIL